MLASIVKGRLKEKIFYSSNKVIRFAVQVSYVIVLSESCAECPCV